MNPDVVIVGAGLAGLACARELGARGMPFSILEASDAVGGRVRTDIVHGFRIDRGFQVLLSAYPEARAVLDYDELDLQPLSSGALVHFGGRFRRVADPFRSPLKTFETARSPIGGLSDKMRVLRLRRSVRKGSIDELWQRDEITTEDALRFRYGFSDSMIDRFFRPFLGGIMLDSSLSASSRSFEFYFRMFSEGSAVVPSMGMQEIPNQLAASLPEGSVRLNTRVASIDGATVTLDDGSTVQAGAVVVATDGDAASSLVPGMKPVRWKSTLQLSWAAPNPPTKEPILILDGDGAGLVNNVQVLSNVAPAYAPAGQSLVTASIIGLPERTDEAIETAARKQLRGWFGLNVDTWRFLRADRVAHALPDLPSLEPPERPVRVSDGLYVAGDHLTNGSIDGALVSGRCAAEAISADFGNSLI